MPPKFVVDAMLGHVAKWLRILGFDVVYLADTDDVELVERALSDGRILVTRDHDLVRRKALKGRYVLVESEDAVEATKQVVEELGLARFARPFSRCPECNTPVEEVDRDAVSPLVPLKVRAVQKEYCRCPQCGRIFWRGKHWEGMKGKVAEMLGVSEREVDDAEVDLGPLKSATGGEARMVKRSEEEIAWQEVGSGAKGVRVRWLVDESMGAENFALRIFEVEPGGYTPAHSHPYEHEVYVLEGEGKLTLEGEEIPIKKGDAIFVPPDKGHQFTNTGSEKLRFICVVPLKTER